MTLNITLIRPEGIWQTADNRVMRGLQKEDDATPKQLHVVCPPLPGGPQVLMSFSGLAEVGDGTPMIQWIRETLRGETRPIIEMLDFLRERLTRDVGKSRIWNNELVISGGVFEGEKRFYVEIRNIHSKERTVFRTFEYVVIEVGVPMYFIGGSGLHYVSAADHALLFKQSQIRPARWDDHLGLLAAVNRRTANRDPKGRVSPWCHGTFLSNDTEGAKGKQFAKPGEPKGPYGMEILVAGVDLHIMSERIQRQMEARRSGSPIETGKADDDGHEAVRARP